MCVLLEELGEGILSPLTYFFFVQKDYTIFLGKQ